MLIVGPLLEDIAQTHDVRILCRCEEVELFGFNVPDLEAWNVTLQNDGDDIKESANSTLKLFSIRCS